MDARRRFSSSSSEFLLRGCACVLWKRLFTDLTMAERSGGCPSCTEMDDFDLTSIEEWLLADLDDGAEFFGAAASILPTSSSCAEDSACVGSKPVNSSASTSSSLVASSSAAHSTCWGSVLMQDSTQCIPGFVPGRGHVSDGHRLKNHVIVFHIVV